MSFRLSVVVHHTPVRLPYRATLKSSLCEQPIARVGAESPSHDAMMEYEADHENGCDNFSLVDGKVFCQLRSMGVRGNVQP